MVKKIIFFLFFSLHILESSPLKVLVSVLPQKEILKRIGGEYVQVEVLVPPGKSPEIYEPSIAQMKHISQTQVFFGVGMPFEAIWFKRFKQYNPMLEYYNLSTLSEQTSNPNHLHNPHIWLSSHSIQPQIAFIAKILSIYDTQHASIFDSQSAKLIKELQNITQQTHNLFASPLAQKAFIIYHPAFEIFAKDFSLDEQSLEHNGKELKGKELNMLIAKIKNKNLKAIFIQPQFSKTRVEMLAHALNLNIIEIDPLNEFWLSSLQKNACQIAFSLPLKDTSSCLEQYFKQ